MSLLDRIKSFFSGGSAEQEQEHEHDHDHEAELPTTTVEGLSEDAPEGGSEDAH